MGIIRILPDDVISKIAAGEIVERPASVVKELIENSLDAGSKRIKVTLVSGGKKFISVEDDGVGMNRDDALLCLERHATSKITGADDILHVSTLGFRGEALPSISSISKLRLVTKQNQDLSGCEILIEGGVIRKVSDTGCPEGTLIEARNLFYNTPPRLKFLKKIETELANVLDVVQRHAVIRNDVSFEVVHNYKTILSLNSRDNLHARLSEIYPKTDLHEVSAESSGIVVHGFLSGPNGARTSTYKLFCYVNGRPVKDKLITRSVISSFGRVIEKGRFPQGVLFIDLPSSEVDINVHPTKSEVRFHSAYKVSELISSAVNRMLENAPWIRSFERESNDNIKAGSGNFSRAQSYRPPEFSRANPSYFQNEDQIRVLKEINQDYGADSNPQSEGDNNYSAQIENEDIFSDKGFFGSLSIVGQIKSLYIVCESSSGMILVDQHAAHERVNYEKYKKQFQSSSLQTQKFLFPEVLELTSAESAVVDNNLSLFADMGFELERFGDWSYLLRSSPALLKNGDWHKIIVDVIGELGENEGEKSVSDKIDLLIATIACHKSVTANQYLETEKLQYLLNELDKTDLPHFCPHGRPVSKEFTYGEMERLFKRT
ncbi:MAG: DNA mismatch repair endonuclease MutL [Candidatus Dadabacteria bacterium]|nr:DNA mismatch repair endonuclease MutL [Candidatus Dadabacteria bacterium]NIS07541.1 DNA mismatch repair endonuclease MutL [Candidatus Dadabacteria bacterium]NIY22908.1 DNA mismatch repair endonuclease MutL [Candidatus Dadabacteria bacterium]